MADLFDQLNKNSGALSAVFSGVVTFATVVYAWLTWKLVDETRQMRQVQTEPRVQITYRSRDDYMHLIDISVKNIGLGPAQDLRFEVRSLSANPGVQELIDSLLKLGSFKDGLKYLGPNQEFTSFWSSLVEGDATKIDSQIAIVSRYKSVTGKAYTHEHLLDLSEVKGSTRIGTPPLLQIATDIEKMEKNIRSLVTGKLRVDTYTQADRDAALERIGKQNPPEK